MKRASVVLALLALGGGAAAASASPGFGAGASINLSAPSSLPATKHYDVIASGHALSKGSTYIFVVLLKTKSCPSNLAAAESKKFHFVFAWPPGNTQGKKVSGSYTAHTDKYFWGGPPTHALLCGYLYAGNQTITSPAKALASRPIHFT